MMRATVHAAGPAVTVQDMGRPGLTRSGLSQGGAADRLALIEAAALLGAASPLPALEMAGFGLEMSVDAPTRIALTGAPMRATLDGAPLDWHACHLVAPGQRLSIGAVTAGSYGYLTPAGGIATESWMESRASHLAAGIGSPLAPGPLALGDDLDPVAAPLRIAAENRFSGGAIRLAPGPQTELFDEETRARFLATVFHRSTRANRQGVRLEQPGAPFAADAAAGLASDFTRAGDVQMTGDGVPVVLLAECQTMGGYPRIGTVIPADLASMAQAAAGAEIRFTMLGAREADALWQPDMSLLADARSRLSPMTRDPSEIGDLLSYQLIGGVTAGDEEG